ncbi:superoxide dismutase family protein [Streptomyces lushanensis]|uniref:superoxide dismutase family protein n=1 Tax=Streptomyces lushanensis TaxID=1434255 RepID=UPI00082BB587|nr:superoxide dismutase family protein [Streptomyces lushanensis]
MRTHRKASAALAVTAVLVMPAITAFAWEGSESVKAEGWFTPPSALRLSDALTYDVEKVPVGSRVSVVEQVREQTGGHTGERAGGEGTTVRLRVSGLLPERMYGAHVHTKPCGATPDTSGPHYQNVEDPQQPSTDPAYANPENEVWLDFTTDAEGHGAAESRHEWRFRPGGARSVVIHEHHTSTAPGEAGTAGARLACLTVPFEPSGADSNPAGWQVP